MRESGFTVISSFLKRRFGFTPTESIVVVFPLTKVNSPTRGGRKHRKQTRLRQWKGERVKCHSVSGQSIQGARVRFGPISHCPWMGITNEVEERSNFIIAFPLPLHRNFKEPFTRKRKEFPQTNVNWMSKSLNILLFNTNCGISHSVARIEHSWWFIVVHHARHRIAAK